MDELQKISEAQDRSKKLKKYVKRSLVLASGAGAAGGAATLLDRYVLPKVFAKSQSLSPTAKKALFALTTAGGMLAAKKMQDEMEKE